MPTVPRSQRGTASLRWSTTPSTNHLTRPQTQARIASTRASVVRDGGREPATVDFGLRWARSRPRPRAGGIARLRTGRAREGVSRHGSSTPSPRERTACATPGGKRSLGSRATGPALAGNAQSPCCGARCAMRLEHVLRGREDHVVHVPSARARTDVCDMRACTCGPSLLTGPPGQ